MMTNTQTPPHATTVVIPTGAPATNTVANHAERPEKFNGQNFKRWQQKMFFYLTTLGLARFLKETVPQVEPPAEGQSSNAQAVQAVEAWKHSDFLCHNYVLNGLIDPLYNVYCKTTTTKELWESLERKYKREDAGTKKFVTSETTSGSTPSGFNLNDEADESEEETQEHRPMSRDRAKKKSSASSREGSSFVDLVADKFFNIKSAK
ncbi:hypothetical protein Tco_1157563 [Tanacetum coccineum]